MSIIGLVTAGGALSGLIISGRTVARLGPRRAPAIGFASRSCSHRSARRPVDRRRGAGRRHARALRVLLQHVRRRDQRQRCQRRSRRGTPLMPQFHAAFSFGGVCDGASAPSPRASACSRRCTSRSRSWASRPRPSSRCAESRATNPRTSRKRRRAPRWPVTRALRRRRARPQTGSPRHRHLPGS